MKRKVEDVTYWSNFGYITDFLFALTEAPVPPFGALEQSQTMINNFRWKFSTAGRLIVHNCTIILCSLDVGNIVQDGDPLYESVNHKQRCGRHNGYSFLLPIWLGREIFFFSVSKISFFWPRSFFFPTFSTLIESNPNDWSQIVHIKD